MPQTDDYSKPLIVEVTETGLRFSVIPKIVEVVVEGRNMPPALLGTKLKAKRFGLTIEFFDEAKRAKFAAKLKTEGTQVADEARSLLLKLAEKGGKVTLWEFVATYKKRGATPQDEVDYSLWEMIGDYGLASGFSESRFTEYMLADEHVEFYRSNVAAARAALPMTERGTNKIVPAK